MTSSFQGALPDTCIGSWLGEMADRPLPGGVAAAAVAAAMGAALIAKAARVTLRRAAPDAFVQSTMEELWDRARAARDELLALAEADSQAFRVVLATRALPAGHPDLRNAWAGATEVPIRVAEACAAMQSRLSLPPGVCPQVVQADLEIGDSLLEAGKQAGLLAVESNLRAWEACAESEALRQRRDALKEITT